MKNKFFKMLSFLFVLVVFAGCQKVENKVYFDKGTAPVLTAVGDDVIVLSKDNPDKEVMSFSWTNPNYSFNTGISSQDVTYLLEFDTTGSNFTNPKLQQFSITNNLATTLTTSQINTYLLALGLADGVPHQIEMRLKAALGTSYAVPLLSNIIKRTITPYSVDPDLWITGDATPENWTNAPSDAQKFAYDKVSKTLSITMDFVPGKEYKFLTKNGQWQPQYGGTPATGGTLKANMGGAGESDPAGIPTPAEAGKYKLTVDMENLTLKVEKV